MGYDAICWWRRRLKKESVADFLWVQYLLINLKRFVILDEFEGVQRFSDFGWLYMGWFLINKPSSIGEIALWCYGCWYSPRKIIALGLGPNFANWSREPAFRCSIFGMKLSLCFLGSHSHLRSNGFEVQLVRMTSTCIMKDLPSTITWEDTLEVNNTNGRTSSD